MTKDIALTPATTAMRVTKPQHPTVDEGIISPYTTTAFRSSINTVKRVQNHYKLVFHLVKAAGLTALEAAVVGS